ncbi:hypothetical protein COT72_00710 [archaeon CG10_big_fil_rev_8_21_14_0_10_43_11]|nr:MAG: hypothetical protein COT72_00710 [archaeon CG10_big_fil_rev_8_21_14_0_10_43_11]
MVVESFLNVTNARNHPRRLILIGAGYVFLSAFLALWIFPTKASFAAVFLTVMAALPLVVSLLRDEELRDEKSLRVKHKIFIREHKDVFLVYLHLFLGLVLGFTLLFILLPQGFVEALFEDQVSTIITIRGYATADSVLMLIIANNLKVLFFCLLFSFLYGSGAIFILTWNASVISAAIGDLTRRSLEAASGWNYFQIIPLSFGRYLVHGLPEVGAYFLAGIAGGILSTALIRNKVSKKYLTKIIIDSADLIVLAILLLFVSALIEVSISPFIGA